MRNDDGSAALEFITVGLILLVPLVYLIAALGVIQEQTLGVEAAARHVARAISQSADSADAVERGDEVLTAVVEEYGLDADAVEVSVTCAPRGGPCPRAGATVTVAVVTAVSLPLMPSVLGLDDLTAVSIEAAAVQKMSRSWGR
ncbi:TadE family protein [Microbacterium sp. XT11]|uniref:TadE family protein n=1 Tax=Microbacterium sp. XT11 TaxID=367477 RepID=UPI000830B6A2|nr:TadE family protein [Microbacterium sp. XT11]